MFLYILYSQFSHLPSVNAYLGTSDVALAVHRYYSGVRASPLN